MLIDKKQLNDDLASLDDSTKEEIAKTALQFPEEERTAQIAALARRAVVRQQHAHLERTDPVRAAYFRGQHRATYYYEPKKH